MACPAAPLRENSNCSSHCRESWLSAGANLHFFAASRLARAKYLLEPRFSTVCPMTFPERSTVTRTATLIWPRMLSRVPRERAGIS